MDEFQNTSQAGIYAVGDVCGRALLTPGTDSLVILEIFDINHRKLISSCTTAAGV